MTPLCSILGIQWEYHIHTFEKIAQRLHNYTKKCTISFIDYYRNILDNVSGLELSEFSESMILELSQYLAKNCSCLWAAHRHVCRKK